MYPAPFRGGVNNTRRHERVTQMPLLRLDYQRSVKPFPLEGAVLLLLSIVVLSLTGGYYYRLAMKAAELEASQNKLERAASRRAGGMHRDAREVMQEVKHANEVLRNLSLPWGNLFQAVESSTGQDVTLLGMEPDIEKHVVRIECEARNITAMLNYIRRLEQRQEFGSIYLQSHRIQDEDPEKPVQFSLFAAWRIAP